MLVRAYVVITVGVLLIRSSVMIVDVLDSLGQRYVRGKDWQRYYDHLRGLVPTFRACLEYALWIGVASLAIAQLSGLNSVVAWGPRLIECSNFGLETMTVRTSTRVKPGRHDAAASALRLAIKEAFDRRSPTAPRRALVPERLSAMAPQIQDAQQLMRRRLGDR